MFNIAYGLQYSIISYIYTCMTIVALHSVAYVCSKPLSVRNFGLINQNLLNQGPEKTKLVVQYTIRDDGTGLMVGKQ